MRAQWKSRALLTIRLIAPLAVMAASSANAQIAITPSLAGPPFNLSGGTAYTVHSDPSPTNTTGNVFVAPTGTTPATLNITGPITINAGPPIAPTAPMSSLVVNGGGIGQPSQNNNTASAIDVNVTGSGVNFTSSGQA